MIIIHRSNGAPPGSCPFDRHVMRAGEPIPPDALWIDLIEPTPQEDRIVEEYLGISVPTREEMSDIEPSELLYTEEGARYMTARVVHNIDVDPEVSGITFILREKAMVTVRYAEPKAFQMFTHRIARPDGCAPTPEAILAGLFESHHRPRGRRAADDGRPAGQAVAQRLRNQSGSQEAAIRSSRTRCARLGGTATSFPRSAKASSPSSACCCSCRSAYRTARVPLELREEVKTTLRDLQSLEEHATFQSQKIQFLLDATLGLVNLEQNNIIKLFSVMAVIFMPPTLVASIYGMNFKLMPELEWHLGYPMAIGIMVMAGLLPYLFFRWKRWL